MKHIKSLIILGLLGLFSSPLFAQPEVVLNSFAERYSVAENVTWEKEGDYWKAEFEVRDREGEAIYKPDGEWVQTEIELKAEELPDAVTAAMQKDFPGYELKETQSVTAPGTYWFEIEMVKGDKEKEVAYSAEGKQLMGKADPDGDDEGENEDND